ncbi:MAG: anaerobic sulfatase maturase, partial [Sedimentisphaerales bacterium]|nr:anaerobic sulfatase maturase [Sedimentisphaerales bacterium]
MRCTYCFYLEKQSLFDPNEQFRMSDEVLEAYIRGNSTANRDNPAGILFAWQGGEPTLMGLDFFKKAVALQKNYAAGKQFTNSLQTNGTLLDDEWCAFLAKNKFLVGVSLDGPAFLHDAYRVDAKGRPTHSAVMRGLSLLKKHGVEYNVLACVNRETAKYPLEVYHFFKENNIQFIQFIPIVERMPDEGACAIGLKLARPAALTNGQAQEVTPWTVEPDALGDFYGSIFDEWVRTDVGKTFIMNFEWAIFSHFSGNGPVCYLSKRCGNCCIVEHNGDVYSCDHFVYPEYKLGNILTDDVKDMINSEQQRQWGALKETQLPAECKECQVYSMCRGGCPKHWFVGAAVGSMGMNYLCGGYKKFYRHIKKYVNAFGHL